ncbi:hypothetical protein DDZ13_06510 [Coraliomargarita sinensis]|uniref:Uncharacterized protein n=1 Tax=Coraliomargarita sinensis TaxID=2174842 RepID=A0A317ZIM3_9BACT|nr:hypothetical protein [Coraliomargarita sinensis]PXA04812.1 hypothetical protein DDZ13_06510 [Coraliomargarita sinensis]
MRIARDEKARLDEMSNYTGIPVSTMAKMATMAALEYYERNGSISVPLTIVPKDSYHQKEQDFISGKGHDTPTADERPGKTSKAI